MFPLPLTVTLSPSRHLRWAILALHALALAATWLARLPAPLQPVLSGLLGMSVIGHWYRRQAPTSLRCGKDGQLSQRMGNEWTPVELAAPPIVMPTLTLLRLRVPGQKRPRPLLILPDSLPAQDFRRLRVWLRWKRPTRAAQEQAPQ